MWKVTPEFAKRVHKKHELQGKDFSGHIKY